MRLVFFVYFAAFVWVMVGGTPVANAQTDNTFRHRVKTEHFVFFSHGENPEINKIFSSAESIRAKFVSQLGADFSGKTKVYIATSEDEFQRLQPNGARAPSWAIGIAWPEQNLIVLKFTSRHGSTPNLWKTFKHELSHIAFGRITNMRKLPKWFIEGIAMFQASEWSIARHEQMMYAALGNSLYSLHDLARNFPPGHAGTSLAYTQSLHFVDWLYSQLGEKKFAAFIQDLANGKDFYVALADRAGMGLDDLETKWLASLKLKYSWLPLITGSGFLWFMVTMLFLFVFFRFSKYKAERMRKLAEEDAWIYGEPTPESAHEAMAKEPVEPDSSVVPILPKDDELTSTNEELDDIFIVKLASDDSTGSRYIIVPRTEEERKKLIERLLKADNRFFSE